MATTRPKCVNFYQPKIIGAENLSFYDLLITKDVLTAGDVDFEKHGTSLEVKFIEEDDAGLITGAFVTTKKTGIAPMRDIEADSYKKVIEEDDKKKKGLAYPNAFLYSKKYNILLLEFNRSGAYPSKIADFFQIKLSDQYGFPTFSIDFEFVLREDAYEKISAFKYILKCDFQVANPTKFIENTLNQRGPIEGVGNTAKGLKASSFKMSFTGEVLDGGLERGGIMGLASSFMSLGQVVPNKRANNYFKVKGTLPNPHNPEVDKEDTVDLFLDRLKGEFQIEEPAIMEGIQYHERKIGIKEVYDLKKDALSRIIIAIKENGDLSQLTQKR